jgi:hypothetical protein
MNDEFWISVFGNTASIAAENPVKLSCTGDENIFYSMVFQAV